MVSSYLPLVRKTKRGKIDKKGDRDFAPVPFGILLLVIY